jgi:cytochrome c553
MNRARVVLTVLGLIAVEWAQAQDSQAGRALAATCTGCHGSAGASSGLIPSINGMEAPRMVALLQAFRDGKREATIMHQLAKGYSDTQMQMLAQWFSAQEP